jgi:hypothetical protein
LLGVPLSAIHLYSTPSAVSLAAACPSGIPLTFATTSGIFGFSGDGGYGGPTFSGQICGGTFNAVALVTALTAGNLSLTGIVTLPDTLLVPPASSDVTLTRGCNEVIINGGSGLTTSQLILAQVSPSSVVQSVWQYDPTTKSFLSVYFNPGVGGAPVDLSATGSGSQSIFICASGNATFNTGF